MDISPDLKAHNISVLADMAQELLDDIQVYIPSPQLAKLATLMERIKIDAAELSDECDPTNLEGAYKHLFDAIKAPLLVRNDVAAPNSNFDMTNVVMLPRR